MCDAENSCVDINKRESVCSSSLTSDKDDSVSQESSKSQVTMDGNGDESQNKVSAQPVEVIVDVEDSHSANISLTPVETGTSSSTAEKENGPAEKDELTDIPVITIDGLQKVTLVDNKDESDDSSEHSFVILDEIQSAASGDESFEAITENAVSKKSGKKKSPNGKTSPSSKTSSPNKSDILSTPNANDITPTKDSKSNIVEEIIEMETEIGLVLEEMNSDDDDDAQNKPATVTEQTKELLIAEKLPDCSEIDSALEEMAVEDEEDQMLTTHVESLIDDLCDSEDSDKLIDKEVDKISSDGESMKDGIDIDSVIEAIRDDEDEISDCVNNIIKGKALKDQADSEVTTDDIECIFIEEKEEICKNVIPARDENLETVLIENNATAVVEKEGSQEVDECDADNNNDSKEIETSADDRELDETLDSSTLNNLYQEAAEIVVNALLNVVSLQFEQGVTLEKISVMQSIVDEAMGEELSSELKEENTFVISNVISSNSEAGHSNVTPAKRCLEEEEFTQFKKPKLDNEVVQEDPCSAEKICADTLGKALAPKSPITIVEDSNLFPVEENKAKSILQEDKASIDGSNSVDVSESNSGGPNIVISNVLTFGKDEKDTSTSEATDNTLNQFPDKPASLSSTSQESHCNSDSEKLLQINGDLKDDIKIISSLNSDATVAKENSVHNDPDDSSKSNECEQKPASDVTKSEKMDILEFEVEPKDPSSLIDIDSLSSSATKNDEDDATTASSESSVCSNLLNSMGLNNGISADVVLTELPHKIDESNEHMFLETPDNELFKILRLKIHEHCISKYRENILNLKKQLIDLKERVADSTHYTTDVQRQMREMASTQATLFRQYGYVPKGEKRTVGVNVRIVQVPSNTQGTNISSVGPSNISNSSTSTLLGTVLQNVKSSPTNTSVQVLSNSNSGVVGVKASQSSVGKAVSSPAPQASPVMVLAGNTAASASHQVVDLTEDESPRRKAAANAPTNLRAAAAAVTTTTTTPVRCQLPPRPGTPQNLVPLPLMSSLPSMVQLLPPGTTVTNSLADGSSVRMVRSSSTIPQPARLAYIMPNTPGSVIHQLGGNPPRLAVNVSPQQFSNMRQPVQTFVLAPMPVVTQSTTGVVRSSAPSLTSLPTTFTTGSPLPSTSSNQVTLTPCFNKHPAPLPPPPNYSPNPKWKALPPKPSLKMNKVSNGIVLSWNMNLTPKHAEISSYQLYAYQENKGPVSHLLWKKVGDIKALPLPMACTLTQFVEGHKYHFSVRAVDIYKRLGPFSEPASILLYVKPKSGESLPVQAPSSA